MTSNNLIWIVAGIGILVFASKTANASVIMNIDFQSLADQYGQDAVNRLTELYSALYSNGLTQKQILFALSQMLHESGLFTDVANYSLINRNNYAGLTLTSGGYATYNSISAFIDSYLQFVSKGADPIDAISLSDFNNRLVANHYYTADPGLYLSRLTYYYNLLNSTIS